MRKIIIILILAICFSAMGSLGEGRIVEAKTETPSMGNIKITANFINVRMDKSTSSKIVCEAEQNHVFELLGEGKDSQGKVWYKVDADFGVTGWVAGDLCKKTNEKINLAIKSKPGELLYECSNKDLFVKLLLLEDYSLDNILKSFGNSYRMYQEDYYKIYEYKNGIKLKVSKAGEVETVAVGGREIYPQEVKKRTCDIFKNKGNELVIIEDNSLIIVDADGKRVLREYNTGYMDIRDFQVGDFIGGSTLELYLQGNSDVYENGIYRVKSSIYKISNDEFSILKDSDSFNFYSGGIKPNINGNVLNLNIKIGNYSASEKSTLPDRVFYNTKDTTDKNKLLSVDPQWSVVQEEGKWYINVRYTVNIIMLKYYWGPPDINIEDNETMLNDLARVDVLLDMSGKTPKIHNVINEIKYNDDSLLKVNPMFDKEGALVDGPALGMSMEEAYKASGEDMNKYVYSEYIDLNGLGFGEFCSEVNNITVESDKYATQRGLKVGDSIQMVESLYGKPDVGLSKDGFVEYKFCYENMDGELRVNYYRTLTIYYEDSLVSSYNYFQVIMD